MTIGNLKDQLKRDEGVRKSAYQDSRGYWTIGVGRLIDGRLGGGLSDEEIDLLLDNDIKRVRLEVADAFPWALTMEPVRYDVMINMAFNLGITKLQAFVKTLDAIKAQDWEAAAKEMEDSDWFSQVGDRAKRLQKQLITGEYQ